MKPQMFLQRHTICIFLSHRPVNCLDALAVSDHYTWQLIIRFGELSMFGATKKTGLWRQSSVCSDTLDSSR